MQNVWIAQAYEGVVKQLLWKYKFERAKSAVGPLAKILVTALPFLEGHVIVTIPTAPAHIRQRGYDHAELLAKECANLLNISHLSLLGRLQGAEQRGATRVERHRQVKQTFYPLKSDTIVGKKILLIDDIITTGATIQAATAALLSAGASQVRVAAVAWQAPAGSV
jgi:ComF family protein